MPFTQRLRAASTFLRLADTMPIVMVLLTAGVVRFYRLGVPSMWWDEVLTAIMSTFPADYIVQWTRQCEVHPPLFYFLVKGLAWFGTSDAALRFPWTATSLLQLFSAYVLCKRWISARAGLLVAALLAANPLHALLSRQLRPYPLILLLQTLSLLLLREWIGRPRPLFLLGLVGLNLVIASVHYLGLSLVGIQVLFVTGHFLATRPAQGLRRWLPYCAANALACLPGLYFLQTIGIRNDMLNAVAGPEVARRLLLGLDAVFRPYVARMPLDQTPADFTPAGWIALGATLSLALIGVLAMRKKDPFLAMLLPFMLVANMALIVIAGQGFFRPRHLLPSFLPLFFLCACALEAAVPRSAPWRWLVCLSAALAPLHVFLGHTHAVYDANSYAAYKMEARALGALAEPNQPYVVWSQELQNALNWYLDRQGGPQPLRSVALTPTDAVARLRYLTESRLDGLPEQERRLIAPLGDPSGNGMAYDLGYLEWTLPRNPVRRVTSLPDKFLVQPDPATFFRDLWSLQGVQILPKEGLIAAAANDRDGEFRCRFELPQGAPPEVVVRARFRTTGPGNRMELLYAFDDGPERQGFSSDVLEAGDFSFATFAVRPETDARRLTVACRLRTGRETPAYPGGNLETNGIFDLRIDCLPPGRSAPSEVTGATFFGLGHVETLLGTTARWALGPRLRVVFESPRAGVVPIVLRYATPLAGLRAEVSVNGRRAPAQTSPDAEGAPWLVLSATASIRQGRNELTVAFDKYNHRPGGGPSETFAPQDPRPLAVVARGLSVGDVVLPLVRFED